MPTEGYGFSRPNGRPIGSRHGLVWQKRQAEREAQAPQIAPIQAGQRKMNVGQETYTPFQKYGNLFQQMSTMDQAKTQERNAAQEKLQALMGGGFGGQLSGIIGGQGLGGQIGGQGGQFTPWKSTGGNTLKPSNPVLGGMQFTQSPIARPAGAQPFVQNILNKYGMRGY